MQQIQAPGTLDGGDVLVIGRQVFVGSSARTNRAAIDQLSGMLGASATPFAPFPCADACT